MIEQWYQQHMPQESLAGCAETVSRMDPVMLSDTLYIFIFIFATGLSVALVALIGDKELDNEFKEEMKIILINK